MQNLPKPGFWKLQRRLVAMKENIRDFPANCSSPLIKSCDAAIVGGGGGVPIFTEGREYFELLLKFNSLYILYTFN